MAKKKIGEVVKFFSKSPVAAVKTVKGNLVAGNSLNFSGHTTYFIDVINSMKLDSKSEQKTVAGGFIGLKAFNHMRSEDEVFKVVPD